MSKILARNFLMNLVSSQCLVCQLTDNETNGFYWGKVNRVVRTPGWLHTRATRDPIESQARSRADHELQLDNQRLSLRHSHQLCVNGALSISYWGEDRQTDSEALEKECTHSFLKQKQWNTNTSSKCVWHSFSLRGTSHSPETDHTHKQFIAVSIKKEKFLSLFQKKMKPNLYSQGTKVNSTRFN